MAVGAGGTFGGLLRIVAKSFLKGGGRIGQGGMCGDPSHGTTPNSCFAMSTNSRGAFHVNYCCANCGLKCMKYRKTFHSRSEGKRSCGSLTEVGRSEFCRARLRESNEPPGEKICWFAIVVFSWDCHISIYLPVDCVGCCRQVAVVEWERQALCLQDSEGKIQTNSQMNGQTNSQI